MAGGIVYVLINEAMPGYVKVGKTDNIDRRLRDLDWTNLPLPFECFYAARVADATFVERQLRKSSGMGLTRRILNCGWTAPSHRT